MRLHLKHCIKNCLVQTEVVCYQILVSWPSMLINCWFTSLYGVYIYTHTGNALVSCACDAADHLLLTVQQPCEWSGVLANRRNCLHAGNVCTRIKLCSCMYSTRFPTYVFFFMLLVLYHMHSSVRSNIFNLVHQTLIVTCIAFNCNLTELQ